MHNPMITFSVPSVLRGISDTFAGIVSEVGTRQVVRALWAELARLVLSGRPCFWPTAVPIMEDCCYWRGKVYAK